jgi:hypothetical protein
MASVMPFGNARHWLRPPAVQAPSGDDRAKSATYVISESYMYCLQGISRLSPIFQLWAHVVGDAPPINNISRISRLPVKPSLTTLADSVACFRGVKRPYDDEKDGASILVYVLNPAVTLVRDADMVCLAKAAKVSPDVALTVQVKPIKKADLQQGNDPLHDGVVTRLEFVPGVGRGPVLPKRHEERYVTRLW